MQKGVTVHHRLVESTPWAKCLRHLLQQHLQLLLELRLLQQLPDTPDLEQHGENLSCHL
jgi:hypothetical protein